MVTIQTQQRPLQGLVRLADIFILRQIYTALDLHPYETEKYPPFPGVSYDYLQVSVQDFSLLRRTGDRARQSDMNNYAREILRGISPTPQVLGVDWYNLKDEYEPLVLELRANAKRRIRRIGNTSYLDPLPYVVGRHFTNPNVSSHEQTAKAGYFCSITDSVWIILPEQSTDGIELPEDVLISNDVASIDCHSINMNDSVLITLHQIYHLYEVEGLDEDLAACKSAVSRLESMAVRVSAVN